MLLLWLLVSSGASGATIKCKNETVTLGKKGLNQWNLTGTLAANQNCVYKITVPTFSSALVTANIKLFSEEHRLIISDQYGAVIQNEGESFVFEVELPDPAVTIRLAIGAYEGEATAPVIEALSVRNVPYEVFEPPYEQSSADLVSEVSLPEKANGSSILFSSTSNVRLIVFSLEEPNLDLLNVHVYSYTDDWTLLGTLYAPAAWESHNSKHLGIFITRKIDSAVSIIATSDTNIAKYGGWNSSFAIVDRGDMSKGPSFCLDSEAGIEAFSIYTMTQEYQNRGLELSDLIVTAIEGNYTSLTVVEKFPSRLGNPAIYWAVGPTITSAELPQLLFGNMKTFAIEGGHACINTSNSPARSGWRQPRSGRSGFIRLTSPGENIFFFKADDGSAWTYNFTFVIEGLPYGLCDLSVSLAGNITKISMTNFPYDPLNTIVFDSEYVNGTLSTEYSQPLTVIFSMAGAGGKINSQSLSLVVILIFHLRRIRGETRFR